MNKLLMVGLITAIVSLANSAEAQNRQPRSSRYQPARPTMSPYLDYFRRDSGVLPRYYTYIQKGRDQQAQANAFQGQLNNLQGRVRGQQGSIDELQEGFRTFSSGGQLSRTGIGARYMNYSHYYKKRSAGGR